MKCNLIKCLKCFQWPRSLRRSSAAALSLECGFESRRRHGFLSLVGVWCCKVEVSAMGGSLAERSPTEFGVPECDLETSTMRPRPTGACRAMEKMVATVQSGIFTSLHFVPNFTVV